MSNDSTGHAGNPVARLLHWLRAGYPEGIPQQDYVALFGLLHRDLTETEVDHIVLELAHGQGGINSEADDDAIRAKIREVVHQNPTQEEVARVAARLASAGWPLMPTRSAMEQAEHKDA